MINLREYRIEDWARITDAVEPFSPNRPAQEFLLATERGVAITGEDDGIVMACGGIIYNGNSKGAVWLKVNKKCLGQPLRWGRAFRETFRLMKEVVGDMEISTYVLKDFCRGERMARLIRLRNTKETVEYNDNIYIKWAL